MPRFKFLPVAIGSGWTSGHVAVDEHYIFPSIEKSAEICLTPDAENFDELSKEIDELIRELEAVRETARRKFRKL